MRRFARLLTLPLALLSAANPPPEQADVLPKPVGSPEGVVIPARMAAEFGLRNEWHAMIPRAQGEGWVGISLGFDPTSKDRVPSEVTAWDTGGVMVCVEGDTGKLRWQVQPTSLPQRYESVLRAEIEKLDVLLALGDHRLIAMDRRSGELLGVSNYSHDPRTAATRKGDLLAYGSSGRNLSIIKIYQEDIPDRVEERVAPGQLPKSRKPRVARHEIVCSEVRSVGLDGRPTTAPLDTGDGSMLMTSLDGEVCVVNLLDGHKRWHMKIPGTITAASAVSQGHAFVGADDQYLRSISLENGRVAWKWFAPAPLTRSVMAAGDLVLTQIPGTGLVALRSTVGSEQDANAHLDGQVVWRSDAVTGDPLTRTRDGVLVWDAESHELWLVDAANGQVRRTCSLPTVQKVVVSSPVDGDVVLLTQSGEIQRCSPLRPTPPPAPPTVSAESAVSAAATSETPAEGGAPPPDDAPTP